MPGKIFLLLAFVLSISAFADEIDSTIPVSEPLYKKKKLEVEQLKISVIPAEGYLGSSIPVAYPKCHDGTFCPDPTHGGRVRFWFVTMNANINLAKKSALSGIPGDPGLDLVDGFGAGTGIFVARRLGYKYFEFRNVLFFSAANGEIRETNTSSYIPAIQGSSDSALYWSMLEDNLKRYPVTPIVGGRLHGESMVTGNHSRTVAFTGAFQLGAGFVLNTDELTYKATGNLDIFRTTIAMLEKDELGPDTRQGANAFNESFRGWSVQNSLATGPLVWVSDVGRSSYHSGQETLWHGSMDLLIRLKTNSRDYKEKKDVGEGMFLNLSLGYSHFKAVMPAVDADGADGASRSVRMQDFNMTLGGGVNFGMGAEDVY